jgi:hypothetical protein
MLPGAGFRHLAYFLEAADVQACSGHAQFARFRSASTIPIMPIVSSPQYSSSCRCTRWQSFSEALLYLSLSSLKRSQFFLRSAISFFTFRNSV